MSQNRFLFGCDRSATNRREVRFLAVSGRLALFDSQNQKLSWRPQRKFSTFLKIFPTIFFKNIANGDQ
jgi:hypothetical protein